MQLRSLRPLHVFAALLACNAVAFAQSVALGPFSPNPALPVVSQVQFSGTGFPSVTGTETILPSAVTLTLTPSAGNGGPVPVTPTLLTKVIGTTWKVGFRIPSALASASGYPLTVGISGSTTSGRSFSGTSALNALQVSPTPIITNVSPGAATRGTTVAVSITGANTHFLPGSVKIDAGAGISCPAAAITVAAPPFNATALTANCTIDPLATPGLRNFTVTTGSATPPETASLTAAFAVSASPALSVASFSPSSALQGETKDILVTGINTHFVNGITTANFSDGIAIHSVTVTSPTTATVNITVNTLALSAYRIVTLVTGGEFALSTQTFVVGPSPATLSSVSPNNAVQSQTLKVTVIGVGTHFADSITTLNFGPGVVVGNIKVTTPLSLSADITVSPSAAIGPVSARTVTGGETVTLANALTIGAATPVITAVSPSAGTQGQILNVTLTGAYISFPATQNTISLGQGITVVSVNTVSPNTLIANIAIAPDAPGGSHAGNLHTLGIDLPFNFIVQPSAANILTAAPNAGLQGSSLSIDVTATGTHFLQGTTAAAITCCLDSRVTINRITVTSPLTATIDITIPGREPAIPHNFTISTGGEVLTVPGGFLVQPATPSLTMSPSMGAQTTTFPVEFTGQFTGLEDGVTTLEISGTGITFSNFKVTGPTSASAVFTVAPDAPLSSFNPLLLRSVTLTTGSKSVITTFAVSPGNYISSIRPNFGKQGQTVSVAVTGVLTSFVNGQTTVNMGPDVNVTGVAVTSPTTLTAQVAIAPNAALGWRTAFVNTGTAEYNTVGFHIDPPYVSTLSSVSPTSGDQGQSLTVTITGLNTNFQPGVTQAIVGAGIHVDNLTVIDRNTATAQISISPTAYPGSRTVTIITGDEIVSARLFDVHPGVAILTSVNPAQGVQGQIVPIDIVGAGTNFIQGATVAAVSGGVTVTSLTVTSATTATAQLSIASDAAIGLQTVTLSTAGESARLLNGFAILQATPTLLSATPATARQADTLNVTLLGRFTHFQQGVTTISFGPGIAINSVTVQDRFTAIANITVNPTASSDFFYTATVTTVTETVQLGNAIYVNRGSAVLTAATPNNARQGDTAIVHITGQNTNFSQGITTADFGQTVNVGTITVNSPTSVDVTIAISPSTPTGIRSFSVNTLGQSATFAGGFTVNPGVPTLNSAAPISLPQGGSGTIVILGQFTHFQPGVSNVTFGQGIAVGTVTVNNNGSISVPIAVDPLAFTGSRTVTVTTGGEIVFGNYFSVTPSTAIISSIAPNFGSQGQTFDVVITGLATHFAQGLTVVSFNSSDVAVNSFLVNSPTGATANITIANNAAIGIRSVSVLTGGESLVQAGGFIVNGGNPAVLSLNPSSAKQGDTNVNVQINGQFTTWNAGTTVNFGSPDITPGAVTVNNPTSITAVVSLSPTAALGVKTVTISTGGQNLTASFTVLTSATVPSVYNVFPLSALVGQTLTVRITGINTHFAVNSTSASFGAGITVNTAQVLSATLLNVNITIDPAAATGNRAVTITTGGEIVNDNFSVAVGTPSITSASPNNAAQGDTGITVNISGQYTTFLPGKSVASFGNGIVLSPLTVNGPTSATATLSVDQLAYIGLRDVTVTTTTTTSTQTAGLPNAFTVKPSPAALFSVTSNAAKQGDNLTVAIVGTNTHFTQGVTTAGFGSGITITNFTVNSLTTATATISIAPLAATGPHTVTLSTQGENASLGAGFTVNPGTPVLLSSTPASAKQQADVTIDVLGQFTSWTPGQVTASLASGVNDTGITIVGVTVTSATSLQIAAHVNALANTGLRNLTITQLNQPTLTLPNVFTVTAGPAAISSLTPATAKQGDANLNVDIVGVNTNWGIGTTANFGSGITVNSFTVNSTISARANISIAPAATPALQTVTLSTQGESAAIAQGFNIQAGFPVIYLLTPTAATQGQTLDVTITGLFTTFAQGTTTANFGTGIAVNSVAVQSPTHAIVNVTLQPTATLGTRDVSLSTNTETATKTASFTVQPGSATISSVTPNSGRRAQTGLAITIAGTATNFLQGTTTANFGAGIAVDSLTVNSPTSATASLTVASNATLGLRTVTFTTAGETATLTNAFTVNAALLQITTATLPNAITGGAYNQTIALSGGLPTYTFSLSSGTLPGGLTLNPSTGAIAGSPNTPATSTFEITVTDGSSQTAKKTYTVIEADPLSIITTALDPGIANLPYTFSVQSQGGVTPLAFTVQSGNLPAGLTLTAATGVLGGTPTVNGTANFTLRVTDAINQIFDRPLSIAIYAPVTFTTTTLPNGHRNVAYNQTVAFSGGVPSLTASVTTGTLPGGLVLNSSTGAITGTPTAAGLFNFQIIATDSKGHTQAQALAITVAEAISITTPATLPNGIFGQAYLQTVQTQDGLAPVSFGITVGALPGGLTLNPANGVISGAPTATGAFSTTIQATDALNLTASRAFNITIDPAPSITSITPNQMPAGQSGSIVVAAANSHFINGTTTATLGAGITVNSVTVTGPNALTLSVTIDPNAATGSRTLQLVTGTESVSLNAAFTVLTGLPAITSLAPSFGTINKTVNVTVIGQNMLGATFQFKNPVPGDTTIPGTISITSNNGATAVLHIVLGSTQGLFGLVANTTLGASAVTDASEFLISPLNMTVASPTLEVLNTAGGTFNLATGTNFAASPNIYLLNTNTGGINLGVGQNSVASTAIYILNTNAGNLNLTPGQNFAASASIYILNTFARNFPLPTGQNFAGVIPISVCNKPSGCPANAKPLVLTVPLTSSLAPTAPATPLARSVVFAPSIASTGFAGDMVEGKTIRLTVSGALPPVIDRIEYEVNGVIVATAAEAPFDSYFTIPQGIRDLAFRAIVHAPQGIVSTTISRLAAHPDLGISIEAPEPAETETLIVSASGLKAEVFSFEEPLAATPDLSARQPLRTAYVTAINQPNPGGIFGNDPLGVGLAKDFAVRYTGQIWIETAGKHNFWLTAATGASLRVDGQPVAADATLTQGWHSLEVDYFLGVGAESLLLEWRQPDSTRQVVAPEFLRTELPGVSPKSVPRKFDSVWFQNKSKEK